MSGWTNADRFWIFPKSQNRAESSAKPILIVIFFPIPNMLWIIWFCVRSADIGLFFFSVPTNCHPYFQIWQRPKRDVVGGKLETDTLAHRSEKGFLALSSILNKIFAGPQFLDLYIGWLKVITLVIWLLDDMFPFIFYLWDIKI